VRHDREFRCGSDDVGGGCGRYAAAHHGRWGRAGDEMVQWATLVSWMTSEAARTSVLAELGVRAATPRGSTRFVYCTTDHTETGPNEY
jgi:hypothetical protein